MLTILGQKGAGKTTFARWLLAQTPRAVVVDRFLEYEGAVTGSYDAALDYLAANWRGQFRLVCRFTSDLYYREMFRFLTYTAEKAPTLPISLIVEEADFFARTHYIEPSLHTAYNYGRHWDINLISVARVDTALHRDVIHCSDVLVVFRTRKFNADMRERFSQEELQRLIHLEQLVPGVAPVKGKHYLTYPADDDPVQAWLSCQVSAPAGAVAAPASGG